MPVKKSVKRLVETAKRKVAKAKAKARAAITEAKRALRTLESARKKAMGPHFKGHVEKGWGDFDLPQSKPRSSSLAKDAKRFSRATSAASSQERALLAALAGKDSELDPARLADESRRNAQIASTLRARRVRTKKAGK